MKTALTALAVIAVLVLAAAGFVYSGMYDVSAANPDRGLIRWALVTTRERSVHRSVEALRGKIAVPDLADPERIRAGLVLYHEMCATCHGAPGVRISAIGQGLNPDPPELSGAGRDEPEETFWVVKNGIKMTGMPAFGVTHDDGEIWAVVAFLRRMGKLSPQEYRAMARAAGVKEAGGEESAP